MTNMILSLLVAPKYLFKILFNHAESIPTLAARRMAYTNVVGIGLYPLLLICIVF